MKIIIISTLIFIFIGTISFLMADAAATRSVYGPKLPDFTSPELKNLQGNLKLYVQGSYENKFIFAYEDVPTITRLKNGQFALRDVGRISKNHNAYDIIGRHFAKQMKKFELTSQINNLIKN